MHIRARYLFLSIFLPFLLLATLHSSTQAQVSPRVLAFYYAWYDANTWNYSTVSDLPAQPYDSKDPAVIARHIQQAQNAGIDAFVVSWIGTNNPTDTNFRTMLAQAQKAPAGFSATIDFETEHFGSRDAVIKALVYVRDTFMTQPAFLRDGGKPVLFFWREQNFSVNDWAQIRNAVDPNHQQIWIAEGVDISYQQVFDGHHLYSIAWSPDVNYTLNDWAQRVRRAGADRIWVATVMPGYDDTKTTRPDKFARARDNGAFYRATWQAAINSHADWVIITSFNEWVEGTMIEPSVAYGNLYLDITRSMSAQFKNTPRANPASVSTTNAATPQSTNSYATTDILRVRAGPDTEFATLGRLAEGAPIQIVGRVEDDSWLEIVYPNGDGRGWVSAEFVSPQTAFDQFPIVDSPPTPLYPFRPLRLY